MYCKYGSYISALVRAKHPLMGELIGGTYCIDADSPLRWKLLWRTQFYLKRWHHSWQETSTWTTIRTQLEDEERPGSRRSREKGRESKREHISRLVPANDKSDLLITFNIVLSKKREERAIESFSSQTLSSHKLELEMK